MDDDKFIKEFATVLNAFVESRKNYLSAEQELVLIQFLVFVTEKRSGRT